MARSGKRMHKPRCKRCRLQRLPEENFVRGLCPACLELDRRYRRRKTGSRLLEKAKDAGTVVRDGQTFRVTVLPPKRRRR
jgi:predicted RNA-binding Zn-ribbon protein involved in translation (DUF1610 family)